MKKLYLLTLSVILPFVLFANKNITPFSFTSTIPIEYLLTANNTINLETYYIGNIDISGYQIRIDECSGIIATPMFSLVSGWSNVGEGLDGPCEALAIDANGHLFAGGYFSYAGDSLVNGIAKWDGNIWSPLGEGLSKGLTPGICNSIAFDHEGNVYAAGDFTEAGGIASNNIAKWDGSSWSPLGTGLQDDCLVVVTDSSGNVYAGGKFFVAGGNIVKYIAKWDGSSWSPLGSGLNGWCYAIILDSLENLYVGGDFLTAGDSLIYYIAKWDGMSWSSLGSGLNNYCFSLDIDTSGNIYAGGGFSIAGGVTAYNIAKWDGNTWSPLGEGLTGPGSNCKVVTLDENGNLYAGGSFEFADGITVNNVAKWDGASWSALEYGVFNDIYSMVLDSSGNLFVGGLIFMAGNLEVHYIAKWETAPVSLNIFSEPNNLSVFPNPTSGKLNFIGEDVIGSRINIIDYSGKIYRKQKLNSQELDISNLPNGMYILELIFEEKKITRLIFKN